MPEHEESGIILYKSTKNPASKYTRARRKRHQNFFLPMSTKKAASKFVKARRIRHQFMPEHEESGIILLKSTKNPSSFLSLFF